MSLLEGEKTCSLLCHFTSLSSSTAANISIQKVFGTHVQWIRPTRKCVLVAIECGELFAIVTAEGVTSVALVSAQPQPVTFAL